MADQPHSSIPVKENCYMVGRRNPDALLQCNTYLFQLGGNGPGSLAWCVDPGSQLDFSVVRQNLVHHLGAIERLQFFTLNHQDPDVVGNLAPLSEENTSLSGLVSEDAWRLARHLGARPRQLHFAHRFQGEDIRLPGGHTIRTVPTPFCHFRGALAFYEPESRILFTGDLFGGLNDPGRLQLWGEEEDWPGIAIFHQIYMPNREAVAFAIRQIRALSPPVEIIAPQHGFALRGDFMHSVMDRLEKLPVGMDRLPRELDDAFLAQYQQVFQNLIDAASARLGRQTVVERLRKARSDTPEAADWVRITRDGAELLTHGLHVLPWAMDVLSRGEDTSFHERLKMIVLHSCHRHNIPLPMIAPGTEGQQPDEWIG